METNEVKYERARKRVSHIKAWYYHLIIYIVINVVFIIFNTGIIDGGSISGYIPWWSALTMPICWGLGVLISGIYAFKGYKFDHFYKRWEERKIQEYLDKEEKEVQTFTKE